MDVKAFLQRVMLSFKNLIYPPLCLHCHSELSSKEPFLCGTCLQLLELINPLERCRFCFGSTTVQPACQACRAKECVFSSLAAAFEYVGPAATLVKQFKYAGEHYLSDGMAAFLVAQWMQLGWPLPDIIMPIPISYMHYLQRGYNQSALLAQGISAMLDVPVLELLSRKNRGYSQAGLNQTQRKQLSREAFCLKQPSLLSDKTILLIDDVMTTSTTLTRAAESLREAIPKAIYALTFCSAVK